MRPVRLGLRASLAQFSLLAGVSATRPAAASPGCSPVSESPHSAAA
jgi:hypothetical protein